MTSNDGAAVVSAAQRVAGTVAARSRGDEDGARTLLTSFDTHEELAGGALLVAELALGLLSEATGDPVEHCVSDLSLRLHALSG